MRSLADQGPGVRSGFAPGSGSGFAPGSGRRLWLWPRAPVRYHRPAMPSRDVQDATLQQLRRSIFAQPWPIDPEIAAVAATQPTHAFLHNPSGQLAYVYLTRYVRAVAEWHLRRSFAQISVLDWGCGKGHVSKLMRDLEPLTLQSCDIRSASDDSAFGQATPLLQHFNIPVTPLEHPYKLPYDDASFDIVLSFGVLEHVPDDRASLREITRVLKPDGLFFCFYLPTKYSWTQKIAHMRGNDYHDRLYDRRSVDGLLSSAGLQPLDLWYRQLLPKNTVHYPGFHTFERVDQFLTEHTPLRPFATNLEFVATKPGA